MPAFSFENEEDFKAWLNSNIGLLKGITSASTAPPAPSTDAAQVRTVVEEQRSAVLQQPDPATRITPRDTSFNQPHQSGNNMIRLVVGKQAPRSSVNNFGLNTFLPDFTMAHIITNIMSIMLLDCKRFFDQSSFFHPVLAHIYIGIVLNIAVFRSMREANILDDAMALWLERFERKWPATSLPIPGPLKNIIQLLAVSKPGIDGFNRVCPRLPGTPRSHNNSFGCAFNGNQNTPDPLSGRIAPIPALLDQYARFRTFVTTAVANVRPNADAIAAYASFGHTICGTQALNAVPNSVAEQTPLVAGLNAVRSNVFNSPGFINPMYCSLPIASNIRNTADRVLNHFPPAAAANNAAHTWNTFFGLDHNNGQWFTDLCELMCLYCLHFSGSCCLSEISEVGNTGAQVSFVTAGAQQAAAATRFPDTDIACSGSIRTPVISDSDLFDAAVAFVHRDLRIAGIVDRVPAEIQSGPLWTNVAVTEDVNEVHPMNGLQVIIRSNYFIAAPKSNV